MEVGERVTGDVYLYASDKMVKHFHPATVEKGVSGYWITPHTHLWNEFKIFWTGTLELVVEK
jgi:hypothetical protein